MPRISFSACRTLGRHILKTSRSTEGGGGGVRCDGDDGDDGCMMYSGGEGLGVTYKGWGVVR